VKLNEASTGHRERQWLSPTRPARHPCIRGVAKVAALVLITAVYGRCRARPIAAGLATRLLKRLDPFVEPGLSIATVNQTTEPSGVGWRCADLGGPRRGGWKGTVNLSNPRAIFVGSPPRFTRSHVTYEAYVVSGTSTRPQVDSARPGAQPYREFVNRWTTDGFRSYVGDLQSSVDRQLEASVGEPAREAEDAFLWVTHYERGFWGMALSG
jgi:hypothetical protein